MWMGGWRAKLFSVQNVKGTSQLVRGSWIFLHPEWLMLCIAGFIIDDNTGYAQQNFSCTCTCSFRITKDSLGAAKFVKDLFTKGNYLAWVIHVWCGKLFWILGSSLSLAVGQCILQQRWTTLDEQTGSKEQSRKLQYSTSHRRKGIIDPITAALNGLYCRLGTSRC